MDLKELRTFLAVADAGSVSAAALRLGISKSLVSRRLHRLEAELGVQLLARSTRGTSLTEPGGSFRDYAARASVEIEMGEEAVRHENELRGRLRIAVPLCDDAVRFTPVIADMADSYPELQIEVIYGDRAVDLIAEGLDCAIKVGTLRDSSLIARRVGLIHYQLVASPHYLARYGTPESLQELYGHKALIGCHPWQFRQSEKIITFQPEGRFKADNSNALAYAAAAGLGVAYLPEYVTSKYVESGALVHIMTHFPLLEGGVYVLRPTSPHPVQKVRVFSDLLAKSFDQKNRAAEQARHADTCVLESLRSRVTHNYPDLTCAPK